VRTCIGLGTERGSTTKAGLGALHFSAGIGLAISSRSSTAYPKAALRILRRRLTTLDDVQQREELLQNLAEVFEQVLVLLFANPPAISGRTITEADWSLHTGAVLFFAVSLTPSQRARQLHLGEQAARSLVETWRQLRQPALLQQQRALALALRRLSYQAGRVRIEDELVDLLVASEALYLSDAGFEELGFRLALRSALLSNPSSLDMTRRQVFDLMKSAYGVRSKIVHGELPKPKDVKVKGVQVPLADFVQTIEQVVRSGVREALRRAVDPQSVWPPDWDDLTLPNT
jgi:hypothetical protein